MEHPLRIRCTGEKIPVSLCPSVLAAADRIWRGGEVSSLSFQSAVDMIAMLAKNDISALELAEEHIRRIEQLNPQLNAIINFDAERVREQARRADRFVGTRGSLHGL